MTVSVASSSAFFWAGESRFLFLEGGGGGGDCSVDRAADLVIISLSSIVALLVVRQWLPDVLSLSDRHVLTLALIALAWFAALSVRNVAPENVLRTHVHELQMVVGVTVPLFDYWKVATHGSWDVANDSWLDAGGGVHYDDGYLSYGGDIEATGPTNIKPNDLRFTATLALKTTGLTN